MYTKVVQVELRVYATCNFNCMDRVKLQQRAAAIHSESVESLSIARFFSLSFSSGCCVVNVERVEALTYVAAA